MANAAYMNRRLARHRPTFDQLFPEENARLRQIAALRSLFYALAQANDLTQDEITALYRQAEQSDDARAGWESVIDTLIHHLDDWRARFAERQALMARRDSRPHRWWTKWLPCRDVQRAFTIGLGPVQSVGNGGRVPGSD